MCNLLIIILYFVLICVNVDSYRHQMSKQRAFTQITNKRNISLLNEFMRINYNEKWKRFADNMEIPYIYDLINIAVDEDMMAVMDCIHNGSSHSHIKWIKDGIYVSESSLHYHFASNGSLVIKNTHLSDSGKYICEMNGSLPEQTIRSKEGSVSVREKLKFSALPTNKNLELMSNAKLVCKARGLLPPIVKWIKWTFDGIPVYEWSAHIRDNNGTLHFNGVKRDDAGNYTCIASSSQGVINASIYVTVIVMPNFTIVPNSNIKAVEGYSATIDCKAEGEPTPTIKWDKNNILNGFDEQRFTVLPNGSLTIDEVHIEDSGKYGCIAGNSGGFKRTEISLTVMSAESYIVNHLSPNSNSDENDNKMTRTVTITLGAAALYMFLVLTLMIYCRYVRAKRKAQMINQTNQSNKSENNVNLEMIERNKSATNPEQHRLLSLNGDKQKQMSVRKEGDINSQTSSSQSSKRSHSPYELLKYPRQDLQKLCSLGNGEFGEVFLAKANIKNYENGLIVMAKTLNSKDENIHIEFRREMDMFHKLNHERVVKLLGICREMEPFLIILEYSDWGDLKQFLLATRDDCIRHGPKPTALTLPQIIGIVQQIAFGMEYLTNNRYVHKDIATRNCLITSKMDIKISSTSLSKDTYSVEYFSYLNRDMPVRWAPYESIFEDEWSAKSDVYSFGVLVWEILSQAELPFSDKSDSIVFRMLQKQELKLNPPKAIPNLLKDLLMICWNSSPKDRPTFTDICHMLNQILLNIRI